MGIAVEQLTYQSLDPRHAGLAAHQNHFVDLRGGHAGIFHGLLAGAHGALQNVFHHLLEAGPRELHLQMLGTGGIGRDERQIDLGFKQSGELHFGLFGRFLETLERHLVAREIDAVFLLEFGHNPVDDALVDIVAAQVGVAVRGLHLNQAFADFEDGDIERSAAEIIDRDGFVLLLFQSIGQGGRGGLVDDAHHFQAGDSAGILGGLALSIVKICRHGNDGLGDFLAQIGLGRLLQFGKDHGRELGRRILLTRDIHAGIPVVAADCLVRHHLHFFGDFVISPAHEALDGENGVFGIGDGLTLGDLANQPLTSFGECHYRRRGAVPFLVCNDRGLSAFHDGDAGIRGAKVNAYDLSHVM